MNTFATQKLKRSYIFSLQNKAFAPRSFRLIFLLASLALHCIPAYSQNEFRSDEISLEIPSNFERVGNPSALLVIRDKTQGFPTFNAVLAPGPWPYTRLDVQAQGQKVIDDYHLVGLKSAEATAVEFTEIDKHQALHTRVHYEAGQNEFFSEIWIIPLVDRHIILTAVYKGQVLPYAQAVINQVVATLKVALPPQSEPQSDGTASQWAVIVVGCMLGCLIVLFILKLKRKRNNLG